MPICFSLICFLTTQAFCIGVLAGATATLATIDDTDIFEDAADGSEVADDVDTYRGIAWWLLVMGIFGIVTQITMLFIRVMYCAGRFESLFVVFGILVSLVSMYAQLFIIDLKHNIRMLTVQH